MCKECLLEVKPDVGTFTTDAGANMLNFSGCIKCKKVQFLKSIVIESSSNDEFEELQYQHVCMVCDHVVATHFYTYSQDDEEQTFDMECELCGKGGHNVQFDDNKTIQDTDEKIDKIQDIIQDIPIVFNSEDGLARRLNTAITASAHDTGNAVDDDEWE